MAIRDTADKLYMKARQNIGGDYISDYDQNVPYDNTQGNVLMCYITHPFYLPSDSNLFYRHQNRQAAIAIANIFNSHGYSVDIIPYNKDIETTKDYDIVFGFGPSFKNKVDSLTDVTHKIYYSTGMYWDQLNKAENERLNKLEQRRGTKLSPERQVGVEEQFDIKKYADNLIVVGDSVTADSYSTIFPKKDTYTISVSSFEFLSDYNPNISDSRGYLWMGSSGLILRGLDVTLEAFSELEDQDLYVCGPIYSYKGFLKEYKNEIKSDNIHLVGLVRLESDRFMQILDNVSFHLYPSASDSAPPGSVTNTMRAGIVPILSKVTTPAELNDEELLLSEISKYEIKSKVNLTSNLSNSQINRMSKKYSKIAEEKYSLSAFKKKFNNILLDIL